jgi:hypothetical protein
VVEGEGQRFDKLALGEHEGLGIAIVALKKCNRPILKGVN